MTNEMQMK